MESRDVTIHSSPFLILLRLEGNALNYTVVNIKVIDYFNMAGYELKGSEAEAL